MYSYIEDPLEIERKSFEIIHSEMRNTNLEPLRLQIMKRVIHTTTDFVYEDILWFKPGAEAAMQAVLKSGCTVVSDTQMIGAGISKPLLNQLGCEHLCLVSDPEVAAYAKAHGMTRSMAAVDIALKRPGLKLFAIGNAPTAIYRLMEHLDRGEKSIAGIIGVPVGFVGAEESKDELWKKTLPMIITKGRKGGSTVAVAIVNALLRESVKG